MRWLAPGVAMPVAASPLFDSHGAPPAAFCGSAVWPAGRCRTLGTTALVAGRRSDAAPAITVAQPTTLQNSSCAVVVTVRATAATRVRSELGLPVIRRSVKPHLLLQPAWSSVTKRTIELSWTFVATSRNQIAIPSKKSISSFTCIAKSQNENRGMRAYLCLCQSGFRLVTVVFLPSASEFNFLQHFCRCYRYIDGLEQFAQHLFQKMDCVRSRGRFRSFMSAGVAYFSFDQ